jgi:hypothetical protein
VIGGRGGGGGGDGGGCRDLLGGCPHGASLELQAAASLAGPCYLPLCHKGELLLAMGAAADAAPVFRAARALYAPPGSEAYKTAVEALRGAAGEGGGCVPFSVRVRGHPSSATPLPAHPCIVLVAVGQCCLWLHGREGVCVFARVFFGFGEGGN